MACGYLFRQKFIIAGPDFLRGLRHIHRQRVSFLKTEHHLPGAFGKLSGKHRLTKHFVSPVHWPLRGGAEGIPDLGHKGANLRVIPALNLCVVLYQRINTVAALDQVETSRQRVCVLYAQGL